MSLSYLLPKQLIATGYNNTEISQQLYISPKTVRNHITSIFSKLQVPLRVHAIRRVWNFWIS